jgi:endonuclease/exonuclease/phosphatase family metal-dependent hydrolase
MPAVQQSSPALLRIMTYNVHRCEGGDGQISPTRIARVIAEARPDIVALQELDVGRRRTGGLDQADAIARELAMEFHFHAALTIASEQYGDAILSRFPSRVIKQGLLPNPRWRPFMETRGALWIRIATPAGEVDVVNTHLGITQGERRTQVNALIGHDWLRGEGADRPLLLVGDLNALPGSRTCKVLAASLGLQLSPTRRFGGPHATFPSRRPVFRLDHVMAGAGIDIHSIEVVRGPAAQVASDHLPLLAAFSVAAKKA